jgi:hypothetical protein
VARIFKKKYSLKNFFILIAVAVVLGAPFVIRSFASANNISYGDLNNDGRVDSGDLSILIGNWGTANASADINSNSVVDVLDLSILLSHYGSSTPGNSTCPNLSIGQCLPYESTSPWNTPIPNNPTIDPNSATYINAVTDNGQALTSDPTQFTIPVYIFSNSTPTQSVTGDGFFHSYDSGNDTSSVGHGSPWTITGVPIPNGAVAGPGSDGQIIIWNPTTGVKYEFWQFAKDAQGNYSATNGTREKTGAGYYGRYGDGLGGRGDGTPYLAGLVRPWEVAQGHIDHALAFAYNSPSSAFSYPAAKSDGGNFGGVLGTDLPEGSRLQLNPSITDATIQSWGCTGTCLTIAHALQTYGMYTVDHSGSSKIYLEYSGTANWDASVTRTLVSPIPWSAFRVLSPGTGPL